MWEQTLNEMADQLSLPLADREPAEKGILALLKASIELAHLTDEPKEFLKISKPYLDILIPESDEVLLHEIFKKYPEEVQYPEWIAAYPDDVDNAFPKTLFLWGLAYIIPVSSNQPKSWDYIDKAEKYFGIGHDFISSFRGWITGEADQEIVENVKSVIHSFSQINTTCSQFVETLKPKNGTENMNADFIRIRKQVQKKLHEVNESLSPFNLKDFTSLKKFQNYLTHDSFRLAVLGEFKRGKSTLINALIAEPGLMPTDFLPCTSALTEIKYGDKPLFEISKDYIYGEFEPSTKEEFQKKAGDAATVKTAKADAEKEAERVPRWQVHIPSSFLQNYSVSLIDSPGIGEDYARNRISQTEAERADAAIIVLNTDQLASIQERELIENMKSKASNLIVAINKADNVPESQWDNLKNHAFERIRTVTESIPRENIVLISALKAEEAIKNSISDDPWLLRLENFKNIIQNHLMKNAGPIKCKMLKGKVDDFVQECQEIIDGHCQIKEKDLKKLQELEKNKKDADESYQQANLDIETGKKILKDSKTAEKTFIECFWENLPKILEKTQEKKPEWTSEHSLLKPKKHVEEVAEKARKALLVNFENWVREEGSPFMARLVDQRYQEAENKLTALKEYLKDTTGVDGVTQIKAIKKQVFIDTFGDIDFEMDGRIGVGLAVTGVVSVVVGYAVADILLYYLFGLISGFLNPFLIAGAVVVAIAGFFMGHEVIEKLVKDKVFSKIKEELESAKNRKKIEDGLKDAISSIFKKMADSFKENASEVLNEAKAHQIAREKEMEEFISSKGKSAEAIKTELIQIKANAEKAKNALDELAKCVEANVSAALN